jgi:hypothetical protein
MQFLGLSVINAICKIATIYHVSYDFEEFYTYLDTVKNPTRRMPKLIIRRIRKGHPRIIIIRMEGFTFEGIDVDLSSIKIPKGSYVSSEFGFPKIGDKREKLDLEPFGCDFVYHFRGDTRYCGVSMPQWRNVDTFFSVTEDAGTLIPREMSDDSDYGNEARFRKDLGYRLTYYRSMFTRIADNTHLKRIAKKVNYVTGSYQMH